MESLVQEENGCGAVHGVGGLLLLVVVVVGGSRELPWKPCLLQGLNGFLFADVQFFRAGPGISRDLGTASCVPLFRHPAQRHPPQQVSW